ncbi:MAG TPA: metallophosphoesterase, partial [Blastocatellia bacterium]
MLPSETFRVLLFVGIIATIYIVAAREVVKIFLRRRGHLKSPESQRQSWYRRIAFTLAAAGILCFAYAYFIEPYWPEVTRSHITTAKLPSLARPIRIAHISDLHSDPKVRLESRLPDIIAAEKPDIIVFTGDAINSVDALPVFKECLRRIAAIAPTFAVRGNWDTSFHRRLDLFSDTGAQELRSSAKQIQIEGASVWIGGVDSGRESDIAGTFKEAPTDAFKVFLCHYPDEIEEASRLKIDLYCAGHTHGGQIALPFYGALITLSRYGKKYEAGLYRVEDTWLYVNRGIGMEGGPA